MRFWLSCLLLVVWPAIWPVWSARPVWAAQETLTPEAMRVTIRAYALGVLPFDGKFTRFGGRLRYDPAHRETCEAVLRIDAASLTMNNARVGAAMAGRTFMDVADYPDIVFHGGCAGDELVGTLSLHGETHPFSMALRRYPDLAVATGFVRRADWGIGAMPFTAGPTIRIRVELPTPPPIRPEVSEN